MDDSKILEIEDLVKHFPLRTGFSKRIISKEERFVRAVDGVSFGVDKGDVFCIAGESGCGKTTLGRTILHLVESTGGSIHFDSRDISILDRTALKELRKEMQMIFQDPYGSLNPRAKIYNIIAEGLRVQNLVGSKQEEMEKVSRALEDVGLSPARDYFSKYPHELSGGMRQRVAIAGALVLEPKLIVMDEPVSMLDVSIRAGILKLIYTLKEEYGLTYMLITHDLSLAYAISNKIVIMYLGKIVEKGPTEVVMRDPLHPYTKALISAIPIPDPSYERDKINIKGGIPDAVDIPKGCRFHPRCPFAEEICSSQEPDMKNMGEGRSVACHMA